ncbi:MAG: hypothetical protein ACOYXW_05815 [Actinomycetota bacterium]
MPTHGQQQTAPDHGRTPDGTRPLGTLANPRRIRWATREERAGR